jgi:hypothetical protein
MKRLIALIALLSLACPVHAATSYGLSFDTETGLVVVSTASATRLFTKATGQGITKRVIINNTGFNLFLSSYSVTMTTTPPTTVGQTTGAFYVPPTTSITLDGSGSPYVGDLWGILASTSSTGVAATATAVGRVGVR